MKPCFSVQTILVEGGIWVGMGEGRGRSWVAWVALLELSINVAIIIFMVNIIFNI